MTELTMLRIESGYLKNDQDSTGSKQIAKYLRINNVRKSKFECMKNTENARFSFVDQKKRL